MIDRFVRSDESYPGIPAALAIYWSLRGCNEPSEGRRESHIRTHCITIALRCQRFFEGEFKVIALARRRPGLDRLRTLWYNSTGFLECCARWEVYHDC